MTRSFVRFIAAASLAVIASIAPSRSHAQSLAEQTAVTAPGPSRFISVNPFLPLFGFFSGEYEQRVKDNVAFAISGSHTKLDDRYTNVDAKLRLYPNEKALEGFAMATSLGFAWIQRDEGDLDCLFASCPDTTYKTFTSPSFAIELSYQWLLGRTRSTSITTGFGAKRYLGGSKSDFSGIERVVPTARLSIGYGF